MHSLNRISLWWTLYRSKSFSVRTKRKTFRSKFSISIILDDNIFVQTAFVDRYDQCPNIVMLRQTKRYVINKNVRRRLVTSDDKHWNRRMEEKNETDSTENRSRRRTTTNQLTKWKKTNGPKIWNQWERKWKEKLLRWRRTNRNGFLIDQTIRKKTGLNKVFIEIQI